jgi:LysR family transcriptional activator of glutamate synthase operon
MARLQHPTFHQERWSILSRPPIDRAPIIERQARNHPRMSFHVIAGDVRMLLRELDARRIDIMIVGIVDPPDEEHSVEFLFNDPLVVIAGPNHALARRRNIDVAELLQHAWTLQPADNPFATMAREGFRALGLNLPKVMAETTSANLRIRLLATGRFLSITPRSSVLFPRKDPAYRILPVALPSVARAVTIITLKNRMLNPTAQLFYRESANSDEAARFAAVARRHERLKRRSACSPSSPYSPPSGSRAHS